MITLLKSQLPVPEVQLRQMLTDYQQALEAHKTTVNVPAPWPALDILRDLNAAGGFVVQDDITPAILRRNAEATQSRKAQFHRKRFTERKPKL